MSEKMAWYSRDAGLVCGLFLVCLCAAVGSTSSTMCQQERLIAATSVYNTSYLQSHCEDIGFTRTVCESARNSSTNFSALYVVQPVALCCDGHYLQGSTCHSCPAGRYGHNCSLACQCLNGGLCDAVTGQCTCRDGWTGSFCEERCSSSTYGPNCSLPCRETCENGGVCHPSSGHCLCEFGWDSPTCNTSCAVTRCAVESDWCSNGATYDPTGFCACRPGWQGRYCTEPCPSGKHGPYCKKACRCENGGLCEGADGSCRCQPGFAGRFCETSCNDGFYGPGCELPCDCPVNALCNTVDGACQECPIGFSGSSCTEPCSADHWGASCIGQCNCIDQELCDRFTGMCTQDLTITSSAVSESSTPKADGFIPKETSGRRPSVFGTTAVSFLAPVIACIFLIIVVLVLVVVLVIKHPCSKQPVIRPESPEEALKLNHQYAGHIIGKEESDYAEIDDIDFGYEVPKADAPENSLSEAKHSTIPNYYQTPACTAPSTVATNNEMATPSSDSNGYLHLAEGRERPSEYQKIIKPAGGFLSQ